MVVSIAKRWFTRGYFKLCMLSVEINVDQAARCVFFSHGFRDRMTELARWISLSTWRSRIRTLRTPSFWEKSTRYPFWDCALWFPPIKIPRLSRWYPSIAPCLLAKYRWPTWLLDDDHWWPRDRTMKLSIASPHTTSHRKGGGLFRGRQTFSLSLSTCHDNSDGGVPSGSRPGGIMLEYWDINSSSQHLHAQETSQIRKGLWASIWFNPYISAVSEIHKSYKML